MASEAIVRERTDRIRRRALELGFDNVGFAPAGHADPDGRLEAWLARGYGGEMAYLARTAAERADPRALLEGARSVVALAISYYSERAAPVAPLKVSRYAQGDDYHAVLRKRVRKLRRLILELDPTARVHPTIDTSAVLEREWARRAGIAWIGKSTMAIAQDLGTYTFLATLVTTLELAYDEPHPDRCGSCTRCLEACPTAAFVGPYELDATRCITYWNVETRVPFGEATPPLHGWVAGCDVCQEVCPWNKFAKETAEPRFRPRESLRAPEPETFTQPERDPELRAAIAGTALQRTGSAAMRRNALRVLAETSSEPLPPRVEEDEGPEQRERGQAVGRVLDQDA